MKITTVIGKILICLLVTQFISGCAGWRPLQMMPQPEAEAALKETFVSALNDIGDVVGVEVSDEQLTQYIGARLIGNDGVIFLYRGSGKSRFAYALLHLPGQTEIAFNREKTANNYQDMWRVEFNGNDAGWATGYTDMEPFFSLTTAELNDRHRNKHKSVLWFKSKAERKRFLSALFSLYPGLTF